jgi:hypothetical protein
MSLSGTRRLAKRSLPAVLAVFVFVTQTQAAEQAGVPAQPGPAQQAPAAPAPAAVQPAPLPVEQSLKLTVLAGNDEMNDLERHVMAPLVVQVTDRYDNPLQGAEVVFRFPLNGPGAAFSDGKVTTTVRTNAEGQVAATGWQANGQAGRFEVHVNATYGNQIGETTLTMTNVTKVIEEKPKTAVGGLWSHRWVKIAVIGGAVAIGVGIYFATRGGGSSGRTVTITPGSPTVTGP